MNNLLGLDEGEKVDVIIDGYNLYTTGKALGWEMDYKKLRALFVDSCYLRRVHYFAAYPESDEFSPIVPLTDWLAYNGYAVFRKVLREFQDHTGAKQIRDSISVELTVQMMLSAATGADHIVLMSGRGDFTCAVQAVKQLGPRVSVISSIKGDNSKVSDDLRRAADNFVDLHDLRNNLERAKKLEVRPRERAVVAA